MRTAANKHREARGQAQANTELKTQSHAGKCANEDKHKHLLLPLLLSCVFAKRTGSTLTVGCTRITRTLKLFRINLRFDCTYTYTLNCFGIHFKSATGNCFGDQFAGCVKEICISPPLRLDVSPFGITLTLRKLHLHS